MQACGDYAMWLYKLRPVAGGGGSGGSNEPPPPPGRLATGLKLKGHELKCTGSPCTVKAARQYLAVPSRLIILEREREREREGRKGEGGMTPTITMTLV